MIQVDDSSDGREVALHISEMLEVRLLENPSTGYRWVQQEGSIWTTILRQVEDRFEPPAPVPGKPGLRILLFEAIGAGDADLLLQYSRAWHKAAPVRSFRLRIRVQPAG